MELISWSLNAIDAIVATMIKGLMSKINAWGKWREVMGLAPLSFGDMEDVCIFGFMMAGLLLSGFCCSLSLWRINKTATIKDIQRLLVFTNKRAKAEADELNRKIDALMEVLIDLTHKLDVIGERVNAAAALTAANQAVEGQTAPSTANQDTN